MKILYFGNICDDDLINKDEIKSKEPYKMAQYYYEKAFCKEMSKLNELNIVSLYQQEYFPKRKLIFSREKKIFLRKKIEYISYINLPFIKEVLYFLNSCLKIFLWNIKNRKFKEKCLYLNIHYAPVSLAVVIMGNLLRIKKVITFTDLPIYTYSKEKIRKMKFYKRLIIKPYLKLINKLQTSYDLYILFSEPMNKVVNKKNKPYLIMEGIYNEEGIDLTPQPKKLAIAYAGKLNKEIGIDKLLNVFSKIKNKDLELWLLGNGDMKQEIIKEAKEDNRIKFLGYRNRREVFKYLKSAKILINLRNPMDEYTKYSFPSKTFEYMVSGTPFITTKLDGIPKEYENYLYIVKYEDKDIIDMINKILNTDQTKLNTFGIKARNFVINNKSSNKQVSKINNFLSLNIN